MQGRIVRSERGLWQVKTEEYGTLSCTLRGKLKGRVHPVVGDLVLYRYVGGQSGVIEEVLPRQSYLSRRLPSGVEHVLAANVDQVILVMATRTPPFRPGAVERLLAYANACRLKPALILTKCDLVEPDEARALLKPWEHLDFPRLMISTVTDSGLDMVRQLLKDKVSVLVGPSGVGKSTMVNAVCPGVNARTGEVSQATSKGKHTTTSSRLYELPTGGYLVDTPGVKELGLIGLDLEDIQQSFPEIAEHAARCRFRDCSHQGEPGCAVRAALYEGLIAKDRFAQYQKMIREL